MQTNTEQQAAWNGPEGERWAEHAARRVADADLLGDVLAAAGVRRRERVLDVGCGTGSLTLRAARLAVDGSALGVDLSELLVAQAREDAAAARVGNVAFEVGDVQTHAFPPNAFDVAVSHFGVMFFADPTAAFANVAAALRPGGRLVFACPGPMERCDWYGVPLSALYGHRPTAAEAPSAMFSLADPAVVHGTLSAAGFDRIAIAPLDGTFWFGADAREAATTLAGTGPVRSFLERHPDLSPDAAVDAIAAAVEPHLGPDGVRLPGAHWLVEARRPVRAGYAGVATRSA